MTSFSPRLSVISSKVEMNDLYAAAPSARTTSRVAPLSNTFGTNPPFALTAGVELIEIRANRSGDRVDETTQDSVFVETFDRSERGLDLLRDLCLARLSLLGRGTRIEPGSEQVHEVGGDRRVLDQRRRH